jgi:outer membrane PBP1 activator LpoA protein
LKPPCFNSRTYEVKNQFQAFAFKCNVYHYIEAALFMRERKPEKAEALLAAFASRSPAGSDEARDAQLMRAQIAASAGDYSKAIEALRSISEIGAKPARAATLVALHELAGDAAGLYKFNAVDPWLYKFNAVDP